MPEETFMGGLARGAATTAADGLVGTLFGLALEGHNDKRQLRQQQKLTDMQQKANQQQAAFSKQLQLDMWNETNYSAQKAHMIKAGLNPGLLYGMKGGGGITTGSANAGGVSGGAAPTGGGEIMGIGAMGLQAALLDAQRRNIDADTKLKETEATKKSGIDTEEGKSRIAAMAAEITNKAASTRLLSIEGDIKDIQREIAGRTIDDQVDIITSQAGINIQEVRRMQRENIIGDATVNEAIGNIKAEYIGALLQNELTAATTKLTKATTATEQEKPFILREQARKIGHDIIQGYNQLETQGKQVTNDEIKRIADQAAGTDLGKQIIDAIQTIILLRTATKPGTPTPIKGFHNR